MKKLILYALLIAQVVLVVATTMMIPNYGIVSMGWKIGWPNSKNYANR